MTDKCEKCGSSVKDIDGLIVCFEDCYYRKRGYPYYEKKTDVEGWIRIGLNGEFIYNIETKGYISLEDLLPKEALSPRAETMESTSHCGPGGVFRITVHFHPSKKNT